jgi:hypothetical protein
MLVITHKNQASCFHRVVQTLQFHRSAVSYRASLPLTKARQLYHTENQQSPGHSVTPAMLRSAAKDNLSECNLIQYIQKACNLKQLNFFYRKFNCSVYVLN